jgi:lipopolysaccharide/colanic/teichoic acid biosynthesis glycosyltransferase
VRQSAVKLSYWKGGTRGPGEALGGIAKRLVDIAVAILALILLAPIFIGTALLVRFSIGGPIIVADRRIGLGGKAFAQYRFRTTPKDAAVPSEAWVAAVADRLRASAIDCLPQLFNVLRGDMSLVGPDLAGPKDAPEVLLARPGVTGMHHHVPQGLRRQTSEIELDRLYVLHWSMWLDLKIACGALARAHAHDTIKPAR